SFVHARAAGSGHDDDGGFFGCAKFNYASDSFAHDRPHGGGEKREIHDRDRDLVTVDHSVPGDDGVDQAGGLLIFLEAIFVGGHSLKAQRIDRSQVGVHLHETSGIEQIVDPFLGRKREMIIALRANAQILVELDLVHNFVATGALLKKTVRNIALLFAILRLDGWFFENRHGYARAAVAA